MVRVREARRAYRRFHAKCFWSCDPDYRIGPRDVAWVADRLRRHGDRAAWEVASKLCSSGQRENKADSNPRSEKCPRCDGTGLSADRRRHCSACLGSGKREKRQSGWQ
jgi:hypothetical protein